MKVLIAIDASPASQLVLEEAAARPWAPDTTFLVASAVDNRLSDLPMLLEDAKGECRAIVQAGAELLAKANLSATPAVLYGSPRRIVSAHAVEWGADLIMAGSHNRGLVSRFFLGSVSQGILRTAACSVEIVRFPPTGRAPSSHPMKILLATDGSACSLVAARCLAARPWPAGSSFKIVSVEELSEVAMATGATPLASIYPESLLDELITAARTHAEGSAGAVRNLILKALPEAAVETFLPTGDPRGIILDIAEKSAVDLIVLGSHGVRGFDRLLMGSVSESVAVHAHCSVEVIRGQPAGNEL